MKKSAKYPPMLPTEGEIITTQEKAYLGRNACLLNLNTRYLKGKSGLYRI